MHRDSVTRLAELLCCCALIVSGGAFAQIQPPAVIMEFAPVTLRHDANVEFTVHLAPPPGQSEIPGLAGTLSVDVFDINGVPVWSMPTTLATRGVWSLNAFRVPDLAIPVADTVVLRIRVTAQVDAAVCAAMISTVDCQRYVHRYLSALTATFQVYDAAWQRAFVLQPPELLLMSADDVAESVLRRFQRVAVWTPALVVGVRELRFLVSNFAWGPGVDTDGAGAIEAELVIESGGDERFSSIQVIAPGQTAELRAEVSSAPGEFYRAYVRPTKKAKITDGIANRLTGVLELIDTAPGAGLIQIEATGRREMKSFRSAEEPLE